MASPYSTKNKAKEPVNLKTEPHIKKERDDLHVRAELVEKQIKIKGEDNGIETFHIREKTCEETDFGMQDIEMGKDPVLNKVEQTIPVTNLFSRLKSRVRKNSISSPTSFHEQKLLRHLIRAQNTNNQLSLFTLMVANFT